MTIHNYSAHLDWNGSTGGGYRAYPRAHRAIASPATAELSLSSDPAFRGDPDRMNPEQLLVMAASSCQLLSFLATAARHGVDVLDYEDAARGSMDVSETPARIGNVELSPVIRVAAGTDHDEVRRLVALAHEECYIANSLNSSVTINVTVLDA